MTHTYDHLLQVCLMFSKSIDFSNFYFIYVCICLSSLVKFLVLEITMQLPNKQVERLENDYHCVAEPVFWLLVEVV